MAAHRMCVEIDFFKRKRVLCDVQPVYIKIPPINQRWLEFETIHQNKLSAIQYIHRTPTNVGYNARIDGHIFLMWGLNPSATIRCALALYYIFFISLQFC